MVIILQVKQYLTVIDINKRTYRGEMLMIPKTCAYVWTVAIGFRAIMKRPNTVTPVV